MLKYWYFAEMVNKFTYRPLLQNTFPMIENPIPKYPMAAAINGPLNAGDVIEIDGAIYDVVESMKK
tara:strand:+ start:2048 stop:2245 length:198 start_codon:yes stop_codon:yes gene_type:complete